MKPGKTDVYYYLITWPCKGKCNVTPYPSKLPKIRQETDCCGCFSPVKYSSYFINTLYIFWERYLLICELNAPCPAISRNSWNLNGWMNPHWTTYFVGCVSFVGAPGILVQAVGDGEECDVVVPQLHPDSLRLDAMQQGGLQKVHLIPDMSIKSIQMMHEGALEPTYVM